MDGYARILIDDFGPPLPPDGRGYLERVRGNAQRMSRLIDDLLSFSRFARRPLDVRSVDMGAFARAVVEELAPGGLRERITLYELPVCRGDQSLLRQVLINLVAAHHQSPRRTRLGRGRGRQGGDVLLHAFLNGARSASSSR